MGKEIIGEYNMTWITVTERCDKIDKPQTKINMDRIVRITPMKNMGCLLTTDDGKDIMVADLLNHFNELDIKTSMLNEAPVFKQEATIELDDTALTARISEVIKNSLRGPNSEINKRLRTTVKEVLAEQNTEIQQPTTDGRPTKVIANSTRNIMG